MPGTYRHQLPAELPFGFYHELAWGDITAENDEELLKECFVEHMEVSRFLSGRFAIFRAHGGEGKTALISAVTGGKYPAKGKYTSHFLRVRGAEDYKSLQTLIDSDSFDLTVGSKVDRHSVFWELYLAFRCLKWLKEDLNNKNAGYAYDSLYSYLFGSYAQPTSINNMDEFTKGVFNLGVSFSLPVLSNLANARVKVSTQRGHKKALQPIIDKQSNVPYLYISDIWEFIKKIASEMKIYVHILLDSIDSFVSRKDYATQNSMVEGLLNAMNTISTVNRVSLRIVIRPEQLDGLDWRNVGQGIQTFQSSTYETIWSEDKIFEFIAKRLAWNLNNCMRSKRIYFLGKLLRQNESAGLLASPEWNKAFSLAVLGNTCKHRTLDGTVEPCSTIDFILTHFSLDSNTAEHPKFCPRFLLIFLIELTKVRSARIHNGTHTLKRDRDGFYTYSDGFEPDDFLHAYRSFQKKLLQMLASEPGATNDIKPVIGHVLEYMYKTKSPSSDRLKSFLESHTDASTARDCVGFLKSRGVLKRKTGTKDLVLSIPFSQPVGQTTFDHSIFKATSGEN